MLLRRLQQGEYFGMPRSRPMPGVGARCHELRIRDENRNWRIIYRIDDDAIVIAEVFQKTSRQTPRRIIDVCQRRMRDYDSTSESVDHGQG